MVTVHNSWLIATALLFIGGCATTTAECDPSRGGFLRGIGCSASGSYTTRADQLQGTLDVETKKRSDLQDSYTRTIGERTAIGEQRLAAEREYRALQSDLAALQSKLSESTAEKKALKRKLAELQQQTELLQAQPFTPPAEKDKQLAELRKRKLELENEVDQALQR